MAAAPDRTVLDMTVMALAEINPAAAAAVRAAGANRVGHPSIGLLGWLPMADLLDVTRATGLAHRAAGTKFWADEEPEAMAADLRERGMWCTPRADIEPWRTRIATSRDAWTAQRVSETR